MIFQRMLKMMLYKNYISLWYWSVTIRSSYLEILTSMIDTKKYYLANLLSLDGMLRNAIA